MRMCYRLPAALVVCVFVVVMDVGAHSPRLSGLDQNLRDSSRGHQNIQMPKRHIPITPDQSHDSIYPAPMSERAYRLWEMAQLIPELNQVARHSLTPAKRVSSFIGGKKRMSDFIGGKKRMSDFIGGK